MAETARWRLERWPLERWPLERWPLERWRHHGADAGGAIVDFIGLSLVLLIPLVYLVVTLSAIQAGAFAAESAAREAARGAVVGGVAALDNGASWVAAQSVAQQRASTVSAVVIEDFGFDPAADATVTISCASSPCLAPGGTVYADVDIHVPLPGIPGFVASVAPMTVSVSGSAAAPVDGLTGAP